MVTLNEIDLAIAASLVVLLAVLSYRMRTGVSRQLLLEPLDSFPSSVNEIDQGRCHPERHSQEPRQGLLAPLSESYNRWRLRGGLPVGVVAGSANALPREWARAWQVSRAGDAERMDELRAVLEAFHSASAPGGRPRAIACLKRALLHLGVIGSDRVASGTRALAAEEAARFDADFDAVRALARERVGEPWVTRAPGAGLGSGLP